MRSVSVRIVGLGAAVLATALASRSWSQDEPPVPEPPATAPADAPGDTPAEAELPPDAAAPAAPAPEAAPPDARPPKTELPPVPPNAPAGPKPPVKPAPPPDANPPAEPVVPVEPAPEQPPAAPPPVPETLSAADRQALDNLVSRLRLDLSVDPALQSGVLSGYRLSRIDDRVRLLELEFQSDVDASAALEQLARQEIALDPYWSKGDPPITEVRILARRHLPVNPERMARYVSMGRTAYRKCDLFTARASFQLALQDGPDALTRDIINFWCVVCDIGMGQTDLAERRLTWLLETYPLGGSTPVVARALQDVQGPIRMAMDRMEKGVLLSRGPYGNSLDGTAPQVPAFAPPATQPYDEVPRSPVPVPPQPPRPTTPPVIPPVTMR